MWLFMSSRAEVERVWLEAVNRLFVDDRVVVKMEMIYHILCGESAKDALGVLMIVMLRLFKEVDETISVMGRKPEGAGGMVS